MRIPKAWRLVLAALLLPGCLAAPSAPPVPAVPGATALPGAAAMGATAAPAAPANLWSFLCPTAAQKQECRQALCNSFLGKLLGSMLTPFRLLTSGSAASPCSQLSNLTDLALPSDSPDGAAARIKQEEAGAAKRRESVRYLGTVDCRYWPEAEGALIKALRSDPNECVRFEAASALTHGCCCTRPIMEALLTTVSSADKDGFPAERSPRVKATALEALHHCLANCPTVVPAPSAPPVRPEKPTPPEKPAAAAEKPRDLDASIVLPPPPPPGPATVIQAEYYRNLSRNLDARLVEEARRMDMQYPPWPLPGQNGVFGLLLELQNVPIHPPYSPSSVEPPLFPLPELSVKLAGESAPTTR